ncbi:MAG: hypothetical protein F6K28_39425 [Microcoleus sp. SIO2G3]|nr:hypothetical protein [Microcoleus sp. SIO2G3]
MIERLQLTLEQAQQLQTIDLHYRDQISALSNRVGQRELKSTILLARNAAFKEVRQQQSEITTSKQQLPDLIFNQVLEIRAILTLAQRQQILEAYGLTIRVRQETSTP